MKHSHWFIKHKDKIHPVAVHWKGKALEQVCVALSAVWVASLVMHFFANTMLPSFVPFFTFAFFCCAQGTKYYFYHEKTLEQT